MGHLRTARLLVAMLGLLFVSAANATPPLVQGELNFAIALEGETIGSHVISIRRQGRELRVTSTARAEVRGILFSLYAFEHGSTELWRDGSLVALRGTTNDDGEAYRVVFPSDASTAAAEGVVSGSFWHESLMTGTWVVSPIDGEEGPLAPDFLGQETLQLGGTELPVRHYRLEGDAAKDLWFGPSGLLVKMRLKTRDGREVELTRTSGPPSLEAKRPDDRKAVIKEKR